MPRRNVLPTHEEIIKITCRVRRRLGTLLAKYPEDDIEPGERIFPRLLTHGWRQLHGGTHGPHSLKYAEASRWADEYYDYLAKLRDYCAFVLLKPEFFERLPVNGIRKPPAAQCVVLFGAQLEVLRNMRDDAGTHRAPTGEEEAEFLKGIKTEVSVRGLKPLTNLASLRRTNHRAIHGFPYFSREYFGRIGPDASGEVGLAAAVQ